MLDDNGASCRTCWTLLSNFPPPIVSSPYNHFCARCRISFLGHVLLLRCTPSFIETERPSPPITEQRSFLNQSVADKSWAVIGCFGRHFVSVGFDRWRCFGDTCVSEEFRPPMLLSFIPKNDISFRGCQKILVYMSLIYNVIGRLGNMN